MAEKTVAEIIAPMTEGLNPGQAEAVSSLEGPVLVVAGPGSGKTRVLTHRVGALLAIGVPAWSIVAVTFTNKAAQEMKERLAKLVGEDVAEDLWVSTFHSLCVKILRRYGEKAGLARGFSIMDADDSVKMIKSILADMNANPDDAKKMNGLISYAKNNLIAPGDLEDAPRGLDSVAEAYVQRKQEAGLVDFDDLLLKLHGLLGDPDVLSELQARFRYILVDEYQDTNRVQYEIVRALAWESRNLCVVGDQDQCLLPGTRIRVPGGTVPIEEITAGTIVEASSGGRRLVGSVVSEIRPGNYTGEIVSIFAGDVDIAGTPGHLVPVRIPEKHGLGELSLLLDSQGEYTLGRREKGRDAWLLGDVGESYPLSRERAGRMLNERLLSIDFPHFVGAREPIDLVMFDNGSHMISFEGHEIACVEYNDALAVGRLLEDEPGRVLRRRMRVGEEIYDVLPLANVREGMYVLRVVGGRLVEVHVDGVSKRLYDGPVYDFEVERNHNYVAEGMLVHNSVYAWRGAFPGVLDGFLDDFVEAKTVTLDQNYRSSKAILAVASAIIEVNPARARAHLWTENEDGEAVRVVGLSDDRHEAEWVTSQLNDSDGSTAIIMRTNAQTRLFEEALMQSRISYQVVGAQRFYDRAEIKDAMAWLRAVLNGGDYLALTRAASSPRRGLGDKGLEAWYTAAREAGMTPVEWASEKERASSLGGRVTKPLIGFMADLDKVRAAAQLGPEEALRAVIEAGLTTGMEEERIENISQLVSSAAGFSAIDLDENDDLALTRSFVEGVALASAADQGKDGEEAPQVSLITAHASKGREFDTVYAVGAEDEIYPHRLSGEDEAGVQEERRLLFVACSRARRRLTITWCGRRSRFGKYEDSSPSPFLANLGDRVSEVDLSGGSGSFGRGRGGRGSYGGSYGGGSGGYGSGYGFGARSAREARPKSPTSLSALAGTRPQPLAEPSVDVEALVVGARVRHDSFGEGVVTKGVVGDNVEVAFADKKRVLSLRFAKISLV